MTKNRTIQLYRGTTAQNDAYTGVIGELTMDTDKKEVRVHDGSTQGGKIISGCHPDLFDWKWADHELDDMQWLRADTFSWHAGSTYKQAYKHLRNDMYNWASWENSGTTIYTKKRYPEVNEKAYSDSALTTEVGTITAIADSLSAEKITVNGVVYDMLSGSNISPTTETVGGVTVQYIPAADGHKIVTDFHESEVADVYTATGEAWYYLIDYGSYKFKLPRGKHNKYASSLGVIGTGISLGLTDGTQELGLGYYASNSYYTGAAKNNSGQTVGSTFDGNGTTLSNKILGVSTDATKSGVVAQQSQNTDQYKYLYFYIGSFTQSAVENTAGLNATLFNNKVDLTSSWGFPDSNYDSLTLGATGASYTATDDGWITLRADGSTSYTHAFMTNTSNGLCAGYTTGNNGNANVHVMMPVSKGQSVQVDYSNLDTIHWFRFVYAKKTN